MGKIVENETFLQQLQQMYAGTKKWGTVRIIIKRLYEEQFKYKDSKRPDQSAYERQLLANNRTHEFDIVVKAANPKRKVSTLVKAGATTYEFQKKLVTLMQSSMFKDVKVAAQKDKKKGAAAKADGKATAVDKKGAAK